LPVIIMSSSSIQEDIDRAYQLGVNAYLVKPTAFEHPSTRGGRIAGSDDQRLNSLGEGVRPK